MAPSRARLEDYIELFENFNYPHETVLDLGRTRSLFRGKLFFDRMLETINIDGPKLYPPNSNRELQKLCDAIFKSQAPEHVRESLLFYLLKDLKSPTGPDVATLFAEQIYLSNKLWTFIEGIWQLDRLHYETALENLTSPSLTPTYSEEILAVLLDNDKDDLALAYYQTVSPSLSNPELLQQYYEMLCRGSITEAFYFSRTQPHSQRRKLLEILIDMALRAHGKQRADNGVELVDLPFDKEEETWFENFLLRDTKGRNIISAADVVMMRKIAIGQLTEAASNFKTLKLTSHRFGDVTWDNIMDGIDKGRGPRVAAEIYEHD